MSKPILDAACGGRMSKLRNHQFQDVIIGLIFTGQLDGSDFTARDVQSAMNGQNLPRCYTTIKTILDRMVEKAALTRFRKRGAKMSSYRLRAKSPDTYVQEYLQWAVIAFFGGDIHQLQAFVREWRAKNA